MNTFEIDLPCGLTINYNGFETDSGEIRCPICNRHNIQQVLNAPKNKLTLRQKELDGMHEFYQTYKDDLEKCLADPNFHIEESIANIKHNLDLRREEVKLNLCQQVDEYYFSLMNMVDSEMATKTHFTNDDKKNIENILKEDVFSSVDKKPEALETNITTIRAKIKQVQEKISSFKETDLKFIANNQELDLENIFGKIDNKKVDPKKYQLVNTLTGHQDSILDLVSFSYNKLLTASLDKTVKLWVYKNCTSTFRGHSMGVVCICLISNEIFASGSDDKTIKIWNINTVECINTLTGHIDGVLCLKLSKSGFLFSGSADKTIKKWNYQTGECLDTFIGHKDGVSCLVETEDENIASGSWDSKIKIWNQNGVCLRTLIGHNDKVQSLIMLNGALLASGSLDNTIKIWNINKGIGVKSIRNMNDITDLFKIRDNEIASSSSNGEIQFWDIIKGECVHSIKANNQHIKCIALCENAEIVSGLIDNSIQVWKAMDTPKNVNSTNRYSKKKKWR